jgi:DNA repair exonuclease SbcCD ATPase subunit
MKMRDDLCQPRGHPMEELELELRISQLESSYEIASNAVKRARVTWQILRADPTSTSARIAAAQKRCEELIRRRDRLRRALDEFEELAESATKPRGSAASTTELHLR